MLILYFVSIVFFLFLLQFNSIEKSFKKNQIYIDEKFLKYLIVKRNKKKQPFFQILIFFILLSYITYLYLLFQVIRDNKAFLLNKLYGYQSFCWLVKTIVYLGSNVQDHNDKPPPDDKTKKKKVWKIKWKQSIKNCCCFLFFTIILLLLLLLPLSFFLIFLIYFD